MKTGYRLAALALLSQALCCALPAPATAQVLGGACSLASQNTPFGNTDYLLYMKCVSSVWTAEAIQPGAATQACAAGTAGQIQWTGTALKFCDGSSWNTISGGAGVAAGSTGDVQFNTSGALAADTGKFFWDSTNHRLGIGVEPSATANYGTLSMGTGPFDGSTAGKFAGNASGTDIAINHAANWTGDLLNFQVHGVTVLENSVLNTAGSSIFSVGSGLTGSATLGLTSSNGYAQQIVFERGSTTSWVLGSGASPYTLSLTNTASASVMSFLQTGALGVDTASPQATLDVNGYMRLAKNSSQPVACSSTNDGAIALTHLYTLCVCKGGSTSWVQASDGATSCSW
jgi:hypothetical protein